ncbi:FAD-dependent oxidoreductase [Balneolaceae bacterium YR4-1]|uniref:FAD-dependent oxidoreductase n=1 Tax=Halalkalibaculum roseum TaxID=2709311 RepID=A0A6M1ST38_9BACT|nr:FAD-dependent oxidoreductase [Halalkalibaculum roseum]NGP76050.1 FAD-dependent oxidoreductase [Halalkalibaculum roseum]
MSNYDYDAVVIGGGSAGLTASGIAANFGAKTMMIERERLGGDCTWSGCVPSKALLKAAKVAHQIRKAGNYGLIDSEPDINFSKLIKHVHEIRDDVYREADAPEIYEEMGIDVVEGMAYFTDNHSINIELQSGETKVVTSKYFFICTGGSPYIPPISGIEEANYLTNESLFEIEELPRDLIIIGAGPIGTEMAQAMNRLGSKVTVIDMADRIMVNDDAELAEMLHQRLKEEGIQYVLEAEVGSVRQENGNIEVRLSQSGEERVITGTSLLMATGRAPNVATLNLEAAEVSYSRKGIEVNDKCRTNKSHIYACGDVTGGYQFTHMSEHTAKIAVTNALLKVPMKVDKDHITWCTFTDPELGQVGATEKQLLEKGEEFETYRFPYHKIDRAVTESEGEGMIKVHAKKWNGKILGVSVVGTNAGEMISEYAVAMKNSITLRNLADTIHPYPTYGLGARRAADQWYIKNQSEWQVKLIKKVFGYRGEIPDFSDPDRIV